MNVRRFVAFTVAAVALASATSLHSATAALPDTSTAPTRSAAILGDPGAPGDTLAVLAVLHSYGYTIDTPTRADRAIRHWQRVNGLTVDGVVGPQTLASLNLGDDATTASRPAVRDNLPPGATVEQIIRFVWPDELENRAVQIAFRESRFVPTARNACCYGLFQINWAAHRGWLADIGVASAGQLLDAGTNARAALALYERDGWRPWNL